jgi:hypothetical protein
MKTDENPNWRIQTEESWADLKASGMLWEFFPEASGIYEEDIKNEIIFEKIAE